MDFGLSSNPQSEIRNSGSTVLRMQLVNSNPEPKMEGIGELITKTNYFIGKDQAKWRTNVPNYAKIKYKDVYPGIDLVYYGNQGQLEYDFVVAPGADPEAIIMRWEGGDDPGIDDRGNLALLDDGGMVTLRAPIIYQEINGSKRPISGHYVLKSHHEIGFDINAYETSHPLVIDPVLAYSTYLGGSGYDSGEDIAVDTEGNAYVTGWTGSDDFPIENPYLPDRRGQDAFVLKLDPTGSSIVYSTYLGGDNMEVGRSIAVDAEGNAYVMGWTSSDNFPPVNAARDTRKGGRDVFVTKLNATGSALLFSTYLGGSENELEDWQGGGGIAIDAEGNAYITGSTLSYDFPVVNAFQSSNNGQSEVFVSKLSSSGGLVYSSYYGGTGFWDGGMDIAVDAQGNAYVTGRYEGAPYVFYVLVLKVNANGSFNRAITLGGWDSVGSGIAVDSLGNIYITGFTQDNDFPTENPFMDNLRGSSDAFVTKLNPDFSIVYSTYLGGRAVDNYSHLGTPEGDIAVDNEGYAYVTGNTISGDFPTVDAVQNSYGGEYDYDLPMGDAFVAKLHSRGDSLIFSTFLGGSDDEIGSGIAVDPGGNIYITGLTRSTNFPTADSMQAVLKGGQDAFVAKIALADVKIVVNSVGDKKRLTNAPEGICDTGGMIDRDGKPELECTLRAAIETVNASKSGGRPTISFNVPSDIITTSNIGSSENTSSSAEGRLIIEPQSPLPIIEKPCWADGTTQPGQTVGFVEIDGTKAGIRDGLRFAADNITIRGFMINNFELYGIRIIKGQGHRIEKCWIGFDETGEVLRLNKNGGILVEDGVKNVTIGSLTDDEKNFIGGGIAIMGNQTRGVKVLRNVMEVPPEWLGGQLSLVVPLDLGKDGPTCASWEQEQNEAPNRHMPPPRILNLILGSAGDTIEGMTRPGATVVAYQAVASGSGRGRYFARRVVPVGHDQADYRGFFQIFDVVLAAGDTVAATATDTDGNTSELSQLRRPVIFLPGTGGSWLIGDDDEELWIPGGRAATDLTRNNDLMRLRMDDQGVSNEQVRVGPVFETLYGVSKVYGPVLAHLQAAGYTGNVENADSATQDLWRFPNDWRRSASELANDLKELIDKISGDDQVANVARSYEVDLVAHSYGGMVASYYVRNEVKHSQNHVHRLITSGTPYLGTPQVAAVHLIGYVFGIDTRRILQFDPDWGLIIEAFRNFPSAYSVMPSENYFKAVNGSSEISKQLPYYLDDLNGNLLLDYTATLKFMTNPKITPNNKDVGMGRNKSMWEKQHDDKHKLIGNWSNWQGPPQIFRMVGLELAEGEDKKKLKKTVTGWYLPQGLRESERVNSPRREGGLTPGVTPDTPDHAEYREKLWPSLGYGDGTVALVSATLGRGDLVGIQDFSGVSGNKWIEEFEEYNCDHLDLMVPKCENVDDTKPKALDRIVNILKSGYQMVTKPGGQGKFVTPSATSAGAQGEMFYILSSAPIAVTMEGADGLRTGPVSPDTLGKIEYGLSELGYWASSQGVVVSAPSNKAYTLQVESVTDENTVRVVRLISSELENENVLFADQMVSQGGGVRLSLSVAGTSPTAAFEVDADGDGAYEGALAPAAQLTSSFPIPAIPAPKPFFLRAQGVKTSSKNPQVSLSLPDVRGPTWQWEVNDVANWITPETTSGETPYSLDLTLDTSQLPEGIHTDTLSVTLSYQNYSVDYPVFVQFVVHETTPAIQSNLGTHSAQADSVFVLPVTLGDLGGSDVYSSDIRLAYNPNVLTAKTASNGQIAADQNWTISSAVKDDGQIWIAMGGVTPLSGGGTLVNVEFDVIGSPGDSSSFRFEEFTLNEGDPAVWAEEGIVRIYEKLNVESGGLQIPERFALFQNYPNPFNPVTTIGYTIPPRLGLQTVLLEIFNLNGEKINTLVNRRQAAGNYRVQWDGKNRSGESVPSGIYIYKLQSGVHIQVRKMMFLK